MLRQGLGRHVRDGGLVLPPAPPGGAAFERRVAVIGDSHALSYLPGLVADLAVHGLGVAFSGISGCPPLKDTYIHRTDHLRALCNARNARVFEAVQDTRVEGVVLIARWAMYSHGDLPRSQRYVDTRPDVRLDKAHALEVFTARLTATLDHLEQAGLPVWILHQAPLQDHKPADIYARFLLQGEGPDYLRRHSLRRARMRRSTPRPVRISRPRRNTARWSRRWTRPTVFATRRFAPSAPRTAPPMSTAITSRIPGPPRWPRPWRRGSRRACHLIAPATGRIARDRLPPAPGAHPCTRSLPRWRKWCTRQGWRRAATALTHLLITRFNLNYGDLYPYSDDWMAHRMEIFERYCLPSVARQEGREFRWLVYFDRARSASRRARIAALLDRPGTEAVFVDTPPR